MESILLSPSRTVEDKENVSLSSPVRRAPRKSIEWATEEQIFTLSPSELGNMSTSKMLQRKPRKSILKPTRPLRPLPPEKKRDITPTPETPLKNAQYLEWPVSTIVDESSTLRELTEAYSILAARIRSSVPSTFFSVDNCNTRHPLFKPLRNHQETLSDAIVRDLGRVFLDPFDLPSTSRLASNDESDSSSPNTQSPSIPSRGGMTEEQVKYARDLSTATIASLKFLILAFQVPAIYNVFSLTQLSSILTAVIAIPLTEKLRSPTARKICGFAINLLQAQRLPECILAKAKDRITFALKRAMEGELGREGKKGAASEAYKAVHDLSQYKPHIFVSSFSTQLPSLFEGLLSQSSALRVSAAHALGGFVLGMSNYNYESKEIQQTISPQAVDYFMPSDEARNSPSAIERAICFALQNDNPQHPGVGPFWAISVLSGLVVLFGPAMLRNHRLQYRFRSILQVGLKSKKKAVRAATTTVWGALIWVWQEWRNVPVVDEDSESDKMLDRAKLYFSQMLQQTTHFPIGTAFIAALIGKDSATCQLMDLKKALYELNKCAQRGGTPTQQALDILDRLVNAREDVDYHEQWPEIFKKKLLPEYVFSPSSGLLAFPMDVIIEQNFIGDIMASQPGYNQVRPLGAKERNEPFVREILKETWITCLEQVELSVQDPISDTFIDIWVGLIRMRLVSIASESSNKSEALKSFAEECSQILIEFFTNDNLDLREYTEELSCDTSRQGAKAGVYSAANQRLKLLLVRTLWKSMSTIFPKQLMLFAAKPMIRYLISQQEKLVPSALSADDEDEALSEWGQLLALVAAYGPTQITETLWNHEWDWDSSTRARAWRAYVRGWSEDTEGPWREAAVILGLPFKETSPWDLSDPDLAAWSGLLSYTMERATRDNVSAPEVLDYIVKQIEHKHAVSLNSTLRVADYLVGTLEKYIENCESLPNGLINLVHEILSTAYPPEPRNRVVAIWFLRSVQTTISNCPTHLVLSLLEALNDGLCIWMTDECAVFSSDEYSSEIIPLFQTILISLQSLPPSATVLQSLSTIFSSVIRSDSDSDSEQVQCDRSEALHSFVDFWDNNCQSLETPEEGWSENLEQVLKFALPLTSKEELSDPEVDSLSVSPRTITPRRRRVDQIPLPPSPSPVRIRPIPLSSSNANLLASSERDPDCFHSELTDAPRIPALFMTSPSTRTLSRKGQLKHKSHRRTPTSQGAIRSRADDDDKENAFVSSEASSDDSVIGSKRALLDASSTPVRASKRQRTTSDGSDDSEQEARDRETVEKELLSFEDLSSMASSRRLPFGQSKTTNVEPPKTPTKRNRADKTTEASSLIVTSPTKRRRMHSQQHVGDIVSIRRSSVAKNNDGADQEEVDDEDDDLPPSDIESEEDDEEIIYGSGSSSPIGPFTPRANNTNKMNDNNHGRHSSTQASISQSGADTGSDDSVFIASGSSSSSSPLRSSRKDGMKRKVRKRVPSSPSSLTLGKINNRTIPPPVLSSVL